MSTGPDATTVEHILMRDYYACIRCKTSIRGQQRGYGWSVHHRRPRRMGGSRQADTNLHANLIILCGSAVTGCHHYIESHGDESIRKGWKLHERSVPAEEPLLWRGRIVLLTNTPYMPPVDVKHLDS